MKLARLVLENFRQFEHLELGFTDELGRARDRVLIVGPNGSGKTTILDAIALALGPTMEWTTTRPALKVTPATIVRRGSLQASVTCTIHFADDEIEAARELARLVRKGGKVPEISEASFTWRYPSELSPRGFTSCDPADAWMLLKGRKWLATLMRTRVGNVGWEGFRRVGAAFTFDSDRTHLGKTIPRDIQRIIDGHDRTEDIGEPKFSTDPREILLSLTVRSKFRERQPGSFADPFPEIQAKYAELCAPRRLIGAVQDELGQLDLQFSDGANEYGWDGLSSGEAMILLFLIRMVGDRIHRSILMIEEVELHQHPIWQRRLSYMLGKIGEDNQIIATTHSDYLRDVSAPDELVVLGEVREGRVA